LAELSDWAPLLGLAAILPPLVILKRWISRHVQGVGLLLTDNYNAAIAIYFVLFLPGVLIHETSHWVTAAVLGLKPKSIQLGPARSGAQGAISLGSVQTRRSGLVQDSLTGLAPLVTGSLAIILIGHFIFGLDSLQELWVGKTPLEMGSALLSYTQLSDFWLWFYLIFAISNAMLPSASDRHAWRELGLFLGILGALTWLLGWAPALLQAAKSPLLSLSGHLAYVCGLTLIADVFFALLIAVIEGLLIQFRGTNVEY